ncbi:MAG: outer membrane beta-barrel protein [Dysgonamonadaceae bacterium]|jgi:tetratricopeptide (TPR) repeat protein|nr:outer membrane beta-barrel protein [Dysgonamonadaceae bacterium]
MKRITILLFTLFSTIPAFCQTLLEEGDDCFDKGNYDCAIAKYREAMSVSSGKDKNIAEIKFTRANRCSEYSKTAYRALNNKDYSQAIQNYQNVLDGNPKDEYAKAQIERCNTELNRPPLRKATTAELTDIWNNKYGTMQERRQKLLAAGIDPNDAQKRINAGEGKPASKTAATLTTSSQYISFDEIGGRARIDIKTNVDNYNVSLLPDWCRLGSKNNGWFSIFCDANKGSQRSGWFKVTAGGKEVKITVSQEGNYFSSRNFTASNHNSQKHQKTYNGNKSCFNCAKNSEKWGIAVGYIQRSLDDDTMDGIQAGLRFEPLFKYGLGLNIGLNYENYSKTFTDYSYADYGGYSLYTYREHVLNIPLHLEYHFNFSKYFNLFAYGGAALDVATDSDFSDYVFRTSLEYGCGLRIDHVQFTIGRSYLIGENSNYVERISDIRYNKYKNWAVALSYLF